MYQVSVDCPYTQSRLAQGFKQEYGKGIKGEI